MWISATCSETVTSLQLQECMHGVSILKALLFKKWILMEGSAPVVPMLSFRYKIENLLYFFYVYKKNQFSKRQIKI